MPSKQTIAATLSLAALAAGQGLNSLSSDCRAGITNLQSNNDANTCLALNQFSNIFLTPSGQSVINSVNNWLVAFCGAPACSNSTIDSVVNSIVDACKTDFAQLGVTDEQVGTVVPLIQQYFGTAKDILCLANTKEDAFCVSSAAHDAEDALGQPLSLENLVSTYSGVLTTGQSPVNTSLIICNDCGKGVVAILHEQNLDEGVNNVVSQTCGADFAASATALPADVAVATSGSIPKGNGANTKTDGNKDGGAATLAVAGTLSAVAGAFLAVFLA